MRVLGIDPGSHITGFGVVDRDGGQVRHVAHGNLPLTRTHTLPTRLYELHELLLDVIERYEPDVAAVEQVFVAASARSALVLGQARGAVLAALGSRGVIVTEYPPSQIKQAVTGSGRATKKQVQSMVRRLLELAKLPAQDSADALAAAICHAQAGKLAALGVAPASRRGRSRRGLSVAVRPVR